MTQGLHIPTSIYNYMDRNFFKWICNSSEETQDTEASEILTPSQAYLSMQDCECKGHDYAGMPTLNLLTNKTEATIDQDSNFYYKFPPAEFELFPKVNPVLRTTFCNLGIWNLYTLYPNITQPNNLMS